jgi:ubiquinone biosynthesis protein UbiJ
MFPGPTLLTAVTTVIERALNRALDLDPAGRRTLLGILDEPVQLNIAAPVFLTCSLHSAGEQILVSSQPANRPELTISGKPIAFAAWVLGDYQTIHDGRLDISGNTDLARQLQHAIQVLNPDWEAAIAVHIGDIPAHFLGNRIRGAVTWSRQAFHALNANIEEYVHEESRLLPGHRELKATFEDIKALNLRMMELEARLNGIENRNNTDVPETL